MAFKKKSVTITGNAAGTVALGAAYGKVHQLHVYGDDTSADMTIADADGILMFSGTSLDFSGTISGENSFGISTTIRPLAYDGIDSAGAVVTDQSGGGFVAKSPLTVTLANNAENTATITVDVYVEV